MRLPPHWEISTVSRFHVFALFALDRRDADPAASLVHSDKLSVRSSNDISK
jgi:hypothetical protein